MTTTDSGPPKPRSSGRSVSRSTKLPTSSAPSSGVRAAYAASRLVQRSIAGREDRGIVDQTGPRIVEWHPTNLGAMAHYRAVGEVPPKRHTQHRDPDGNLYREELMGEEGFSSDSSLLYHRGVPSAIVGSEIWELPDQTRTPNHPLKPRHLKLHELATDKDPVTGRRLVLGNNDVRIGYVVTGVDPSPYYRNAIGDECVYVEAGSGTVETVLGVLSYRTGDYVIVPRATTHRWVPSEPSQLYAIEANSHVAPPKRYLSRYGQLLEHAPYCERDLHGPTEPFLRRRATTSRCWSSTAPAPASSAPG